MAVTSIFSPHRFVDMFSNHPEAAQLFKYHANTLRDNALGNKQVVPEPFPRDVTICIWLCVMFGPTAWRVIDRGIAGRLFSALAGGHHHDFHTIVTASLEEIENLYDLKPLAGLYGKSAELLLYGLAPTIYGAQGTRVDRKEIRRAYMEVPTEIKTYHDKVAKVLSESGWTDHDLFAKASCVNLYDYGKNPNKFLRFQYLVANELELAQMVLCVVDPSVNPDTKLEDFVDYARINVLRRWVRDMFRWMDCCGVYLPFGSDEDNYQKLLPQLPAFWRKWDKDTYMAFAILSIAQPTALVRNWTDESQFTNYAYRPTKGKMH